MATSVSTDILNQETDARFAAQSGYKPGQKLDPNNPADKAYVPVWNDTFRKVKAEADAGKLVTTYDHPEVAQNLNDAAVAHKAAAAHADIAAATTDPATKQENVVAATAATKIAAQKAGEAAAKQPPTVSPKLVQEAGKEAIKTPPHPSAPAEDHIAHVQAHKHAHGHHLHPKAQAQVPTRPVATKQVAPRTQQRPMTRPAPTREVLYKAAIDRFRRFRPGPPPNMADARDRQIWEAILQQVQHEVDTGAFMYPPYPQQPMQQPYPYPYPAMQQPYPYPPSQQTAQAQVPPPHARGHRHHHQHPMTAAPSGTQPPGIPSTAPASAPEGDPSAEDQGAPPDDASAAQPDDASSAPSDGTSGSMPPLPAEFHPEEPSSIGKYVAIGAAAIAGGLLYYVTKHKPSGKGKSRAPAGVPAGAPAFPPARAVRA